MLGVRELTRACLRDGTRAKPVYREDFTEWAGRVVRKVS